MSEPQSNEQGGPRAESRFDTDHAYVRQAVKWLRSARESAAIAALLDDLDDYLLKHFEHEEGKDGLFAFVLRCSPRHAAHVAELVEQHTLILDEIRRLRATIEQLDYDVADDKLLAGIAALAASISRHEHREQGLLQDALERDIGGGD
jgi:hypothetical protein